MRSLILSDIHANWEALEAVLSHASGKYDRILCCGDLVGYGADPNRVVDWVRANVAAVVRGNHDKACAGLDDLEWFNPVAKRAALWTRKSLEADKLEYLKNLPQGPETLGSFQILHGSPLDEDEYVVTEQDAVQVFPYVEQAISFFGHTHVQGGFQANDRLVRLIPGVAGESFALEVEKDGLYLVNPGSVGQPRDGDPRAAYAVYDEDHARVMYWRVGYDLAGAQRKIVEAGLPAILATRLATGT